MKQSIKVFIEEIKNLKNEKKFNLTDIAKSKDVTSSFDNQISEEEFMEAMKDHCKKEKEKSCPYCKRNNVVKYGFTKNKKQRYKCKECGRYYCITTNTPMYYSKKVMKKWFEYYKLIGNMTPIRQCAKILDISIGTAFQWRHKILNAIMPMLKGKMEGTIEIDEVLIPESFKGNHSKNLNFYMDREPVIRKRSASEYVSSKKVSILCCKDRQEKVFVRTGGIGKIGAIRLYDLLSDKIPERSILCTTNNIAYIPLARKLNCKLYKLRGRYEVIKDKYHIQNAGAFGKRIVNTINYKFKGVATKYLNFYLSWFHWQESNKRETNSMKLLDALSMSIYSNQKLRVCDFKNVKSLP
ncbi:Transposase [Clostridium sp. N3C]|uniref:IS1595 family transposase n=1 Tax=Clostridium sp. N3C TaxID=1776758 RepID=UPI00092E186B|nr:IS1595 family transposase [Clostridium sp. N3C]SCN23798.1 Transposase [Clostridium sp. N3C]